MGEAEGALKTQGSQVLRYLDTWATLLRAVETREVTQLPQALKATMASDQEQMIKFVHLLTTLKEFQIF
jgi:hypothetical protein